MTYTLDWQAYTKLARQTVAEGAVLLHNDGVLPLQPASTVAVFGRNQFNYYKSGTGSGGMVNVTNVVSPLDMLREDVTLNADVLKAYETWLEDHPFEQGPNRGRKKRCRLTRHSFSKQRLTSMLP